MNIHVHCVYEREDGTRKIMDCIVDGGWIHAQRIMLTGRPKGEGWKLIQVKMEEVQKLELTN